MVLDDCSNSASQKEAKSKPKMKYLRSSWFYLVRCKFLKMKLEHEGLIPTPWAKTKKIHQILCKSHGDWRCCLAQIQQKDPPELQPKNSLALGFSFSSCTMRESERSICRITSHIIWSTLYLLKTHVIILRTHFFDNAFLKWYSSPRIKAASC